MFFNRRNSFPFSCVFLVPLVFVVLTALPFEVSAQGQDISQDVTVLLQANKTLCGGSYREALKLYSQVSDADGALKREATLGKCICYAMMGFKAETVDEAIENFQGLIETAAKTVDLTGLGDGSLFINIRFIQDLLFVFEKTGHLGAGDSAQGAILEDDSTFRRFAEVIEKSGTDVQKKFSKFFQESMELAEATSDLEKKDFEGSFVKASKVKEEKPQHLKKSSKSVQEHSKKMIETRDKVEKLKSLLERIRNNPNPDLTDQAIEIADQIRKNLTR